VSPERTVTVRPWNGATGLFRNRAALLTVGAADVTVSARNRDVPMANLIVILVIVAFIFAVTRTPFFKGLIGEQFPRKLKDAEPRSSPCAGGV